MTTLKFKVTLLEDILGTATNNKDIYKDFIASKAPNGTDTEDELDAIGSVENDEKGVTVFPRDEDGNPIMWDYQIKGFFKDACSMLNRLTVKVDGKKKPQNFSGTITAYKKEIDGLIFVQPRMIPIKVNGEIGLCQRPLRAQTAQGERIALACSESIPAGSTMEFKVICLNDADAPAVLEWMDYGELRGLGQWRNSGKGRFTYEVIEDEE